MLRRFALSFGWIFVFVTTLVACTADDETKSSSGIGGAPIPDSQAGGSFGLDGATTTSRQNVGGAFTQPRPSVGGSTSLARDSTTAGGASAPDNVQDRGGASANWNGGASATANAPNRGGTNATGGAGATHRGGANTSGGASALGGTSARNGTATAGGKEATGGKASVGGKTAADSTAQGGSTTQGGTAKGGNQAATGGSSGKGGASAGSGGKACHSMADWTPKSGDLWISPSGNDSNDGTEESPKKTLTAAISKWSTGKTIWVLPGTYALSAAITVSTKATSTGPLVISGVKGGAKPIFDFSSEPRASDNNGVRGLQLSGSYVHLRYLEFKKAADNCLYVTGSNNTLEWLSVHECQDTGVQLSNGAASNKILNVDSYLNADPTGENADGFAPKLDIGQNNYFWGTRSYQNADDGYDCWAAGDGSPVTFEYCWAFGQPGPTATASSDGNGFKLGSPADRAAGGNAAHKLISCFAFNNRASGFTANGNSSGQITCTNCAAWGNGVAYSAGTGGKLPQHTGDVSGLSVSTEKAMNAARDANGNLPDIKSL